MIIFPRPFAIAIDDLGWIEGRNEGKDNYGPYRTGIDRKMTLADYEAVVNLAKKLGIRLQGLFILGEMDRENILDKYPTTTHKREKWDNSENISDLQLQMMDFVKNQSANLEFGLHGIGHEYWPEEGVRRRAEWYNTEDDHPWPEEEIRAHVECFIAIMRQYDISKEMGHSFPESFVPCAYSYYWNPKENYSLGSVLSEYGVKYANTDFTQIPECNPPEGDNSAGFDHGVHVMNRFNYGNLWDALEKLPETPFQEQTTDYIETHWPNLLAINNEDQSKVTQMWVEYYQKIQASNDRYFSKNTSQHHAQWLYKKHTVIEELSLGNVSIDNSAMPDEAYSFFLFPGNLVLKIKLPVGKHLSSASIDGSSIPAYFEDQGYAFLYLPCLQQAQYTLTYELGEKTIQDIVWHDGTSNIYEVIKGDRELKFELCLYGSQTIKIRSSNTPISIESINPDIQIIDWYQKNGLLHINMKAHDIQGEIGSVRIHY